jgi:hypothetical protein
LAIPQGGWAHQSEEEAEAARLNDPAAAAKVLYEALEFELAAKAFEELATNAENPPKKRAKYFVWMAMSLAGLGKSQEVNDALFKAVQLDPTVAVPESAPPKVRELVDLFKSDLPEDYKAPTQTESATPSSDSPAADELPEDGASANKASLEEKSGNDWIFFLSGGGMGLLGLAAGVGAGLMANLSAQTMAIADDTEAEQLDVQAAQEEANGQLGVAYGLAGAGAVGLIAGGVLLVIPLFSDDSE